MLNNFGYKYICVPTNIINSWSVSNRRTVLQEEQAFNKKSVWYMEQEHENQQFPKRKGRI
jgi:hypothetical protein